MKRLNVAYVVSEYPSLTQTFVLHEMTELHHLGASITVFAIGGKNTNIIHPELSHLKADIVYLDDRSLSWLNIVICMVRSPVGFVKVIRQILSSDRFSLRFLLQACKIARLAVDRRIDVLHAHFANRPTQLALATHELTGLPFGFTTHAYDLFVDVRKDQLHECVREAAHIVTISEYNRHYLRDLLPDCLDVLDSRAITIHMGVPIDSIEFRDTRGKYRWPQVTITIITVARLIEKKGHLVVASALKMLHKLHLPIRWVVVGDGPLLEVLKTVVTAASLSDWVEFTGALDSASVRSRLEKADIFVLPCIPSLDGDIDGIPVVLMEAMAVGVPVISTTLSGIPELITDGEQGFLVPPSDPVALANAIKQMIELSELRRRFVLAAREKVEQGFDCRTNTALLYQLLLRTQ